MMEFNFTLLLVLPLDADVSSVKMPKLVISGMLGVQMIAGYTKFLRMLREMISYGSYWHICSSLSRMMISQYIAEIRLQCPEGVRGTNTL
jgi:hypothetical protein